MGVICTKSKNEQNVKAHYEFGNDTMEMCFDHKTRIKVDHRNKSIKSDRILSS
jgi:cyclopropane fatty-acyl-phospholipid synthase-like methyltransferase